MNQGADERNPDIRQLERQMIDVFSSLFGEVPMIDANDTLDGENLALFLNQPFTQVTEIMEQNDFLDAFPFFSLITDDEGKYYLGGFMLYFLTILERSRILYPRSGLPSFLPVSWCAILSFLKQSAITQWVKSSGDLQAVVTQWLAMMINHGGFEFAVLPEELKEITALYRSLAGAD